ncbi:hypothetical protein C8A03DRAFT_37086 [Achaetomium macrosporum]|uniref:Peptidase C14 caspase domain-containing protein n=1 Tax=Achaetomium macrosporum TaxID=79813 RepID=A0AAN7C4B2_9PEZI|nr:hypothetical protein C8A03DRAFT_37086 [Achaetomium macrosporum]
MDGLTRHALLIGIDSYAGWPSLNLAGCVNDIRAVENFLQTKIGVPKANITKLLASRPDAAGSLPDVDNNEETDLPTYDNIINRLELIRDSKNIQVDLLYIHYSAHGLSLGWAPSDVDSEKEGRMWMALSTHDAFENRRYLSGHALGSRIQGIIDRKGARVCLVLDTCFSGAGLRSKSPLPGPHADHPSPLPELHQDDHQSDPSARKSRMVDVSKLGITLEGDVPGGGRDVTHVRANWTKLPVGCTVLSACGMDQEAAELRLEGRMQGVFTHYLVKTLGGFAGARTSEPLPSYERIRREVDWHIRALGTTVGRKKQVPVVRGESGFEFFGNGEVFEKSLCGILNWRPTDGHIGIDVGSSQGVARGAIYRLYPHESVAVGSPAVDICIDHIDKFCSAGKPCRQEGPDKPVPGNYKYGTLQAWALRDPAFVRLQAEIGGDWAGIERELNTKAIPNLRCWVADEDEPVKIHVAVPEGSYYELQSGDQKRLARVPRVPRDDPDAARKVARMLQHIARYQDVETFALRVAQRSSSAGELKVECKVLNSDAPLPRHAEKPWCYQVTEDHAFDLHVAYSAPRGQNVWMALFTLNGSWGIQKVYPMRGENAAAMQSNSDEDKDEDEGGDEDGNDYCEFTEKVEITTGIPPKCVEEDPAEMEDRFLVFVCRGIGLSAPSWEDICLPSLPPDSSLLRPDDDLIVLPRLYGKGTRTFRDPSGLVQARKKARPPQPQAWLVGEFRVCTTPKVG